MKIPRDKSDPGKGCYWALDSSFEEMFEEGRFWRRKRRPKQTGQTRDQEDETSTSLCAEEGDQIGDKDVRKAGNTKSCTEREDRKQKTSDTEICLVRSSELSSIMTEQGRCFSQQSQKHSAHPGEQNTGVSHNGMSAKRSSTNCNLKFSIDSLLNQ